jgi:sulfide dehydrogenase cytochrome subunit
MKIRFAAGAVAWMAASAATGALALAQDAANTRALAATCANCHGTDGRSVGAVPGLAGLDKTYLAQQMRDFKAGKRPATVMQQLAKGYTDEQIDQLAGYFSALKK